MVWTTTSKVEKTDVIVLGHVVIKNNEVVTYVNFHRDTIFHILPNKWGSHGHILGLSSLFQLPKMPMLGAAPRCGSHSQVSKCMHLSLVHHYNHQSHHWNLMLRNLTKMKMTGTSHRVVHEVADVMTLKLCVGGVHQTLVKVSVHCLEAQNTREHWPSVVVPQVTTKSLDEQRHAHSHIYRTH